MIINTPRVRLRCWEQADRDAFAAMHADPEVMHDYGGPISREESDAKLDRYAMAYRQRAFCRWAVEAEKVLFLVTQASCHRAAAIRSVHISRWAGDWYGTCGVMGMPRRPPGRH